MDDLPPLYIFFLVYPIYIFGENLYKSAKDVSDLSETLIHKCLVYPWMCPGISGKGPGHARRVTQEWSGLRGMEGQTFQAGNQIYYIYSFYCLTYSMQKNI